MSQTPALIPAKDAYRRLLKYVSPYKSGFVLAVFGMLLVAATESGFAALMRPMLDGSFVDKDPQVIKLIPIALLAIFLVRGIGSFLSTYCMTWMGRNVIHDLRGQIFNHLLKLPIAYYDQNSTGRLTSKLIYDVEQVANATTSAITIIIRDTFTIIGLVGWMLYLNWKLSMLFLVVTPIISIIVVYISKRFRRISRRIQASMGNVNQIAQQTIEGNRVVKIYGGDQHESAVFKGANDFNRRQNMKMALTSAISVPLSQFFGAFALAGMLYFATKDSMLAVITPGTFMSFVTASMLLLAPLKRLTQVSSSLQQGIAAAQSIFQLLDQDIEKDTGTKELQQVKGEVSFENLSFSYAQNMLGEQTAPVQIDAIHDEASNGNVLNNINFTAKPGQSIAIVGRSGSGKSTLVSLIARFYEPTEGCISIDGVALPDLRLSNLRQHIALVSQDVTLFNDSIANNIAYGCDIENHSEQEAAILKAATAAHAIEFIRELPQGMDTIIGEKGALLSGGQRQRIAIARALLKDAPILILDEATSALDTESERFIQDALEKLMVGRTTFVIAHRLSTIEHADCILVLDDGNIVEQGTHENLLKSNGHYAGLHKIQFQDKK